MKHWVPVPAALALAACVTINVYFPAAEAKEAAREFVDKVMGEDGQPVEQKPTAKPGSGGGMAQMHKRIDPWSLVGIGSAYAQSSPDITINTPAIRAIQSSMQQRFDNSLRAGFDAGALGFTSDGLITVRDASKLELKDRVAINSAVADDNRDRKALYREVAVANGHPEWENQIRDVFARQWVERARSGWWYQSGGSWKQK
ncbi:MAG: YdbL family protein [Pseudomonadota bacterium]|nr:YdbL family protein [Pseudomonadota bacterium]